MLARNPGLHEGERSGGGGDARRVRRHRPTPSCRPTNGPCWSRPWPGPASTGPIMWSCRCIPGSTRHVLAEAFAAEWRNGVCVPVAKGLGAFWPTASTRTLVPAGGEAPAPVHVKLPGGHHHARRPAPAAAPLPGQRRSGPAAAGAGRWPPPGVAGPPVGLRRAGLVGLRHSWRSRCLRRQAGSSRLPAAGLARRSRPRDLGGVSCRSAPSASCSPTARRPVSPASSPTGATTAARRRRPSTCSTTWPASSSEVALACFGLGFMPELHGQNALLACEGGRVTGIVLRDHDTVRLHRPWLAAAGLADPGYDVKPGAPNSLWAAGPEELLGWFQTLAVEVAFQAIGRALVDAYGRRRGNGVAPSRRCGPGRPVGRRPAAGRRRDRRPAAVPRRHLADQARDRSAPRPARDGRRQHAERHRPGREPVPGRRRPGRRTGRSTPSPSGSSTASCGSRPSSRFWSGRR